MNQLLARGVYGVQSESPITLQFKFCKGHPALETDIPVSEKGKSINLFRKM